MHDNFGQYSVLVYDSTIWMFIVWQGVTYDTGGADVKAGGHMAGMHR